MVQSCYHTNEKINLQENTNSVSQSYHPETKSHGQNGNRKEEDFNINIIDANNPPQTIQS